MTLPVNQIICGDCLEVMKGWPDNCVDAVVTDPPYGLKFRGEQWDSEIPDWLPSAKRCAPIVAFSTAPLTAWHYPCPDWVIAWHRPGSAARNLLGGLSHWSPILVYGKGSCHLPIDVIYLHAMAERFDTSHPTPKPTFVFGRVIEYLTSPGDLVLDPFLGSGTTAVVCERLGRRWIGCEINSEYAAMAEKRIQRERDKLQLPFDAAEGSVIAEKLEV